MTSETVELLDSKENIDSTGDHGRSAIPMEKRRDLLSISMVTAGFCIGMSGLFTGAAMASGLSLRNAIIATLIGNLIVVLYSGLCASIGTRYGVSASMISRQAFGRNGAKLIGLIIPISLTGWYSFQCAFFGSTIHTMFPEAGLITHPEFATLWGGILMMITAIIGFKGLQYLSNIGVPLLVLVSSYGIVLSFRQMSEVGTRSILAGNELTLVQGIVMTIGAVAVAGVVQADISRYAKSVKDCWISTFIGFIMGNSFVIITGVILMKATNAVDIPSAMMSIGLGVMGLIVLIVSQWTTNDNNLYSSSLALLQLIPNAKKAHITIFLGTVGTLLGALGIYNVYIPFLLLLGSVIPPISGIIIADFYLIKKEYTFGEGTEYASWNISALIALVFGSIVGLKIHLGVSSINAMVAGFIAHFIISKIIGNKAEVGTCIEDIKGF